ncbi:MAG: hypothetical protein Kow0077_06770 [Anaerolineae bacterium]
MKSHWSQRFTLGNVLLIAVLVVTALLVPGNAYAQGNLLVNGDFEQPHGDGINLTAPPGWRVVSNVSSGLVGRQLQAGTEVVSSAGIYSGSGSFDAYKGWATYNISLYQTVSGIQPGSTLRLSAFGRMWSCDSDPEQPTDDCITGDGNVVPQTNTGASFRVGIDPTGSDDPNSPNIVWSGATAPYEGFQQMIVEAAAQGDRVTVVLNAGMQLPARHQHVFWDAASLEIVTGSASTGGSTGQTTAPPAFAPEVVPQGPREDGSVIHTVRPGDTVAAIAVAYDITIPELLELNGMTMDDARLIYPGQELIVVPGDGSAPEASPEGSEDGAGEQGEGESAETSDQPVVEGSQKPIESYDSAPVAAEDMPVLFMNESATTGTVCTLMFEDVNPNRLREGGENLLAGAQISLLQGDGEVGTHMTDGQSEPYCFDNLAPGEYLLVANPPSGYGMTTASTYEVTLSAGKRVTGAFGAAAGFVPPVAPPAQGNALFSDEAGQETDTVTDPLQQVLNSVGYVVLGLAGVVFVGGIGLAALLRR